MQFSKSACFCAKRDYIYVVGFLFGIVFAFTFYWFVIALIFVNSDAFYKSLSGFMPNELRKTIIGAEDIHGKSSRTEYLYWILFLSSLNAIFTLILIFLGESAQISTVVIGIAVFTINLILLPPSISVTLRRLNSNYFSKKFILLFFVPLGGLILLGLCLMNRNVQNQIKLA